MQAQAHARYIRFSPKKLKKMAHVAVGLTPQRAMDILLLSGDKGGRILASVIKSASSNATSNHAMKSSSLQIRSVEIGKGPFFKRWQPVSRGIAHSIKKQTSHIKVIVEERADEKKQLALSAPKTQKPKEDKKQEERRIRGKKS